MSYLQRVKRTEVETLVDYDGELAIRRVETTTWVARSSMRTNDDGSVEARCGSMIGDVIAELVEQVTDTGAPYRGEFNGTPLLVCPGDSPERVYDRWMATRKEIQALR